MDSLALTSHGCGVSIVSQIAEGTSSSLDFPAASARGAALERAAVDAKRQRCIEDVVSVSSVDDNR